MSQSDDYKRGYSKGYSTGQRSADGRAEKYHEEMEQAVHRAERAEAAQGFGKCMDCQHWTRGGESCRWGHCAVPRSQFIGSGPDSFPLWFGTDGDRRQNVLTSDHFGCVLFRQRRP